MEGVGGNNNNNKNGEERQANSAVPVAEDIAIPTAVPVTVTAIPTYFPGGYISVETAESLAHHQYQSNGNNPTNNAVTTPTVTGAIPVDNYNNGVAMFGNSPGPVSGVIGGGNPHDWPSHICDICAAGPIVCCFSFITPMIQFGINHLSLYMVMNQDPTQQVSCTYKFCICCGASTNYTFLVAITAMCGLPCYAIPHYHFRKKLRSMFNVYGYVCLPVPPCCDDEDPRNAGEDSICKHYATRCWKCVCHSSNCDGCIVTLIPCCAMIQEARLLQRAGQVHVSVPAVAMVEQANIATATAIPATGTGGNMLYAR